MPETYYTITADEVLDRVDTRREGLSSDEAKQRLDEHGPNSIRTDQRVSHWKVLIDQFIGLVLVFNANIGFIQEYKAATAVQSLKEMVSPKSKVRRDGSQKSISADDLMPGDVVLLEPGGVVPADIRSIRSGELQVNEAALTGESVVMTVALKVGVRRMALRNAVIRHLPVVQTLGIYSVIVSDKTGTLTHNEMMVQRITAGDDDSKDATSKKSESDDDPSEDTQEGGKQADGEGDPMEIALLFAAEKAGMDRHQLFEQYPKTDEIPFRTEQRFSATIHDNDDQGESLVLVKGAPERIGAMCSRKLLSDGETSELDQDWLRDSNERVASGGLQVLAMAVGHGDEATQSIHGDKPSGFTFVGMTGLSDPPRPEAVEAVDKCHQSGIRVIMVTGDHASTASAIAGRVHLDRFIPGKGKRSGRTSDSQSEMQAATGQELEELSDAELDKLVDKTNVFARVKPNHKVRIVNRLKARDSIVAGTGDGVNDAPA